MAQLGSESSLAFPLGGAPVVATGTGGGIASALGKPALGPEIRIKQVPRIPLENRDTDRAVELVRQGVNAVTNIAILGGRQITNITMADSTNVMVRHGLGRRLQGWMVTRMAGVPITAGCITEAVSDDPTNHIILRATGYGQTMVVDLWVY